MSTLKESEFKSEFAFGLARQFHGMWTMLRQGIEKVPDNDWHHGRDGWFYSLRIYHIIETAEFYTRDTHEGMQWGKRLGKINWWEEMGPEEAAKLVTKKEVLVYLDEIEQQITKLLQRYSDKDLMKKDGFHWFSGINEKLIYSLRHNIFHIGELAFALHSLECDRIKWE
jgi:hypothetical protein